jgi:hypothetical protein
MTFYDELVRAAPVKLAKLGRGVSYLYLQWLFSSFVTTPDPDRRLRYLQGL